MKAYLGAGWYITHLADRSVELRKDDYVYRKFTGNSGFVRIRSEPGMDRNAVIDKAIGMAQRNDEELALRVGKCLAPSLQSLADYTGKVMRMEPAFRTPEDSEVIGRKRA